MDGTNNGDDCSLGRLVIRDWSLGAMLSVIGHCFLSVYLILCSIQRSVNKVRSGPTANMTIKFLKLLVLCYYWEQW